MKIRLLSAMAIGLALSAVYAQDVPSAPPTGQSPAQGPGPGGWQGQRGRGMGGPMGRAGMGGNGVMGTVTAVAADRYTIKTEVGEIYTVRFSANTHILKAPAQRGGPGGRMGGGQGMGRGQGEGMGGSSPQELKAADIKVGDVVAAMGEMDAAARSVGAITVIQFDPAQVRQMLERQASFGKTWLQGKVTAIDGVKVTLFSNMDNAPHAFTADENTTFRKRRDPVTLADVQVGDTVRVEGVLKNGIFAATAVTLMGQPMTAPPPPPGPHGGVAQP